MKTQIIRWLSFALSVGMAISLLSSCSPEKPIEDPGITTTTETEAPIVTTDAPSVDPYFSSFKPILRFSVASDVHIHDSNSGQEEARLAQMFKIAYDYAENSDVYGKLDAAIIAGDHVDKGTLSSMKKFRSIWDRNIRDDTKTLIALGNHEFYTEPATVYDRYEEAHGTTVNEHVVINGFHFIKLSPTGSGWNFDATAQRWLKNELKAAAEDDPSGKKPIFVIQHQHIQNTVYGSSFGWGVPELTSILAQYPQVIDFSGHSHYPIQNPLSIWQGAFTCVGTGTLSYLGFQINGLTQPSGVDLYVQGGAPYTGAWTTSYDGKRDSAQFLIVEVDKNGAVVIIAYDMLAMKEIRRYYIKTPSDPSTFEYTDARIAASKAPAFAPNTEIVTESVRYNTASVSFPQASGDDIVESYRIEIQKNGKVTGEVYLTSCYFYTPMPERMVATLNGLEAETEYEVLIYPVNVYGKEGKCIQTRIQTEGFDLKPADSVPAPDIFQAEFTENGVMNAVSGTVLETLGGAKTVENDDLGRYVGDFGANGCFKYRDFEKSYSKLARSLTYEAFIRLDSYASSYCSPFSNQQSGGVGFEVTGNGIIQFYVNIGGTYICCEGSKLELGQYYHIVGSFDGSHVRLYVNGVLASEKAASGSVSWPGATDARYLSIGADSGPNGDTETPMDGQVAVANVYSKVLSDSQIYRLYLDMNK